MARNPGLAITDRHAVDIGGLQGVVFDIKLAKGWTKACPYTHGVPLVPLIVGVGISGLEHAGPCPRARHASTCSTAPWEGRWPSRSSTCRRAITSTNTLLWWRGCVSHLDPLPGFHRARRSDVAGQPLRRRFAQKPREGEGSGVFDLTISWSSASRLRRSRYPFSGPHRPHQRLLRSCHPSTVPLFHRTWLSAIPLTRSPVRRWSLGTSQLIVRTEARPASTRRVLIEADV